MVAALDKWVKTTLQPKARERFKSPVVRILGGSGYSCRNIYNLPNARLSQHALANAVDIGAFSFQNGKTIAVLKGWGLTARDIVARKKALGGSQGESQSRRPLRARTPKRRLLIRSAPTPPRPSRASR